MSNLHISISAEPVFHIGSVAITNSIITSWIVSAILIGVSLWAYKNVKNTKRPRGLQNILEMIVDGLYGLTANITESSVKTKAIFPFFMGYFLFILLNNWFGLLPGVGTIGYREPAEQKEAYVQTETVSPFVKTVQASTEKAVPSVKAQESTEDVPVAGEPTEAATKESTGAFVPYFRAATADLNTTVALALVSVLATQFIGIKFLGLSYFKKFINFSNPINGFVGILETISEISKIVSFAFRLFGNIFAGEVLLAVMSMLIPLIVPMPFIALEIFVGLIQAFVFAMLTLVFMNMASQGHEGEAHA